MVSLMEVFAEEDAIREIPCLHCRHIVQYPLCKAFTHKARGIPMEIRLGKNDHRHPYPGDHGIQFEPIAEPPAS